MPKRNLVRNIDVIRIWIKEQRHRDRRHKKVVIVIFIISFANEFCNLVVGCCYLIITSVYLIAESAQHATAETRRRNKSTILIIYIYHLLYSQTLITVRWLYRNTKFLQSYYFLSESSNLHFVIVHPDKHNPKKY